MPTLCTSSYGAPQTPFFVLGSSSSTNTVYKEGEREGQKPRAGAGEMAHPLRFFALPEDPETLTSLCNSSSRWNPLPSSGIFGNCMHVIHYVNIN